MDIEKNNTKIEKKTAIIEIEKNNTKIEKNKVCRKRLSYIVTIIEFIAMFLQLLKFIIAQDTKVSGYNKVLMNVVASGFNIYLKCTSHDKEFNNTYHIWMFTIRRAFVFGIFCYFIYVDSLNDFSSFTFTKSEE